MQGPRIERLAHQFQQEIAMILQREFKDPRLGFVTITRVTLSKDVSHATVLFGCLGDAQERERSQEALDHSAGYIRGLIKKRFRLKVIPMLQFQYDESIEGSITLSETLEGLKRTPNREGGES
ncbi:MAG: 30S ribosome-binding factor RbfA [Candidatus Omnitrophota bacterium]|nr:30S ribosome-binding factor RbfA [Candidatus Omnitrophota bacterium]